MDIETLLGLQQAHADLSRALDDARMLAPLQDWIDRELTPLTHELGRRLRHAQRHGATDFEIARFAQVLQSLQEQIRQRVDEVCATACYASAVAAWCAAEFGEVERMLPHLLSDVAPATRPPRLLIPFDLHKQRLEPGGFAFPAPSRVAERIAHVAREGLAVPVETEPPWLAPFPYVVASPRAEDLATPVWLIFDGPSLPAAVLANKSEPGTFRIYAPRLKGLSAVGIAKRVDDEWWLSQEPAFAEYRLLLAQGLREHGVKVEGVD